MIEEAEKIEPDRGGGQRDLDGNLLCFGEPHAAWIAFRQAREFVDKPVCRGVLVGHREQEEPGLLQSGSGAFEVGLVLRQVFLAEGVGDHHLRQRRGERTDRGGDGSASRGRSLCGGLCKEVGEGELGE